jgi:hypothetical protein
VNATLERNFAITLRISYFIIGANVYGWRDVEPDRGVTVQRGDTIHSCRAHELQPGDLARGVNHSRIMTGPPVRIIRARTV